MAKSTDKINTIIFDIKRRWQRRALKQGIAVSLMACVFFAAVYLIVNYRFEIPPFYQSIGMIFGSLGILALIIQFVVRPAFRRIHDRQIALYIEEKLPELEDRINSAVEIDSELSKQERNIIFDKVIDDAAEKAKTIHIPTIVDRKKERILSYVSYAFVALFLLFLYAFMDDLRRVTLDLEFSLVGLTDVQQELFATISPGDIEIEKGQSQGIVVELRMDTERDVVLHYKSGEDIWKKQTMEKGFDKPVFLYQFPNIQEPIDYFVELDQERSPVYAITLYEFPKVTGIHVKYAYPSYTGLPDRTEENSGTIRGLKGSTVTLTVEATGTAKTGKMVLNNGTTIPMRSLGDGRFRSLFTLDDPAIYHIVLTDEWEKNNKFPEEYRIVPLDDEQPVITITDPQMDIKANPIEEVLISVTVTDDYGVNNVRLKYSVNGDEIETETMVHPASAGETSVSGSYLFLFEDFNLEPGDLVSYYIEAEDNFHTENPESSDMYFIEIAPFETQFTQVSNQGQQGGGGQQQSRVVLNQQQIIAATWKLHRLRDDMSPEEFTETLDALLQAQSNLKDDIEQRVNSTAFSMELIEEEINQEIVQYLKTAVTHMGKAVDELTGARLREAISPEQKALNNLLRAEALNREKRVQLNRQQGGQTGQMASEDFMTELQDLELDFSRDKYELQQQRQQQQQDQEVDDTLEKIRELARKQQKLAEQSRQAQKEEQNERLVDQLRREQEQLRQQAEDLANSMNRLSRNNQQFNRQMQDRLQEAQQNMRQASQSMRNNNLQKAMSQQRQAINNLDRLQQDLQMARAENTRDMLENFMERFEQFQEQENRLAQDIEQTYKEMQQTRDKKSAREDIERLSNKRENMIQNTERLENLARAVEEKFEMENPKVATDMRNFNRTMQREKLKEKMEDSQMAIDSGALQWARWGENDIQLALERLANQAKNLESEIPPTEAEKINRGIQDVREQLTRFEDAMTQNRQNQESLERDTGNQRDLQENEEQDTQQSTRGETRENAEQLARADELRIQRELQRSEEILDRLQRDFRDDPTMQNSIRNARSALGRFYNTGVLLDEASAEFFKNTILESMSQVEMNLLKQMNELELDKKLYEARVADVPPEYKKSVEKYFETLSKARNKK